VSEAKIASLTEALGDPAIAGEPATFAKLQDEYEAAKSELDTLLGIWEVKSGK